MPPDPKPARRHVDRTVTAAMVREVGECECCGRSDVRLSGHHVLKKGQQGDDVRENILVCCGDGVAGCHGALEGNVNVWEGKRYEPARARLRAGLALLEHRPDIVVYVTEKLGLIEGPDFLRRTYGLQTNSVGRAVGVFVP